MTRRDYEVIALAIKALPFRGPMLEATIMVFCATLKEVYSNFDEVKFRQYILKRLG